MEIQDRYFELLKREIFKDTSLDFNQFKNNYLKRRLGVRMRVKGVKTYDKYLRLLFSDPGEYDFLLKDITINVTEFFRDPEVFHIIWEEILPLMIYNKVKHNRRVIRLWSAGCSSGEEPYSLAILMRDLLAEKFDNFVISIYGTDIDDASLETAKMGIYLPRQVENVEPELLSHYFKNNGEKYEVKDEIKDMVKFKKLDLFSQVNISHFDIIFCRNVMIYFNKDMQEKLFQRFHESLNDGGYLIIGKTEGIFSGERDKFEIINSRERIYQKK
jgi:chemotaxis protein methyltransferase CheR